MVERAFSWRVGPAESRLVRTLLYLATALVPAYPIVVVLEALTLTGLSLSGLVIGLLFTVVLIIVTGRTVLAVQAAPTYWVLEDFLEVLQLRWLGVTTLLAIGGLAVVSRWAGMVYLAFFLVWFPCLGGVLLLSSHGTIDPGERVLTYVTVRRYAIPLDTITTMKQFEVGQRTYLWLSFHTTEGTPVDRLVMVPTVVYEQIASVFERAQTPADETKEESTSQSWVELVAGVLVFGGLSVGLALILYLGGLPLEGALALPVVLFGVFFLYFLIAHYTNLFTLMDAKKSQ